MKLEDFKEAVTELINEISVADVMDVADDVGRMSQGKDFFAHLSKPEQKVIRAVAQVASDSRLEGTTFEKTVEMMARHKSVPMNLLKFDMHTAKEYVCSVVAKGGDGRAVRHVKKGTCPASWNYDGTRPASGRDDRDWMTSLSKEEKVVLIELKKKIVNGDVAAGSDFEEEVKKAAADLGLNVRKILFLRSPDSIDAVKEKFKQELGRSSIFENKKRGFGEGDPPEEEIYKKQEVVQEIDAETPEAAQALGDASKEQGEAAKGVADAHTRAAQAAKQRQDASKAWKDAKITQVKAIDAAEKAAAEEAKATDAQSQAMDAAQKATDAAEKAQGEKEKYLDVAKQAAEAEKEAASAAEEAAKAEEEAENELSDSNTAAADADQQRSEKETDFGDAVSSDEEERAKEDEEAKKAEEEAKKADEEREKKEKEADRKAADKEAQDKADSEKDSKESEGSEEEPMTEMIKNMVRQVMSERKWGEAKDSQSVPPAEKLKQAGITAQDLKGMVLNTVMAGEEERDLEIIKLLKDMLGSLQSIEYHSTPAKGASSQMAQAIGKGWVNEGDNRRVFKSIPTLIAEMRDNGLEKEADDHESFFKWALANSDLTMQEIKNEADAQIADLKKMLRKMSDHVTGKEDSLEKQKLRGEVPGHH
tara:strand:+ start:1392 stop:3335 length:1944 start_codon:yes stop_codon:yes gene_type:complete